MSFLAQKFTSTYKAARRQSLSSTKGQTLAPKATNSVVRFTLQRSPWDQAEARLQPRPHPCSVASPLACCLHSISDESAPSVNHFTDPQLRLCLGNPSSFSKLLGPWTVSQVANQTPFEYIRTWTILSSPGLLEQLLSLHHTLQWNSYQRSPHPGEVKENVSHSFMSGFLQPHGP